MHGMRRMRGGSLPRAPMTNDQGRLLISKEMRRFSGGHPICGKRLGDKGLGEKRGPRCAELGRLWITQDTSDGATERRSDEGKDAQVQ